MLDIRQKKQKTKQVLLLEQSKSVSTTRYTGKDIGVIKPADTRKYLPSSDLKMELEARYNLGKKVSHFISMIRIII